MADQQPPDHDGNLTQLAAVLDRADHDRTTDLHELLTLEPDQIDYLAQVATREDPASDGLEGRCI